ncbi:hypothetical protein BZG36_03135 [Bifiguratus adelaidae]|uniref:GDP/GTP exchange factor Sec2 N-terminal domain-containing protein n=1 Tax=Bifiguratus adelaidae TaxID=1938954 RepID=A0A261XXD4_9FUNG|nr:hypothetical protein BZG36_03135 [Bifiguratus adelaidae]
MTSSASPPFAQDSLKGGHNTSNSAPSSPRDVTAKDIQSLYSRLQAVMDSVKDPPSPPPGSSYARKIQQERSQQFLEKNTDLFARNIPLPASPGAGSPPISPASPSPLQYFVDSPSTLETNEGHEEGTAATEEEKTDCVCYGVLDADDLSHCAQCGRKIPAFEALLKERKRDIQDMEELQQKLREEVRKVHLQALDIETLRGNITDLQAKLDTRHIEFTSLQKDIKILNEKYVDEIERVAEIQHSKDMVESELEDLSRKLFEEANGMVANEKRERRALEIAQRHLENQLRETQERLAAEQMQLTELREKLEQVDAAQASPSENLATSANEKRASYNVQDPMFRSQLHFAELFHIAPRTDKETSTGRDESNQTDKPEVESANSASQVIELVPTTVDEVALAEFQEFVKTSASYPLSKIHSIPFMKNCLADDVDTCLRFGPNPRVSARKIANAIVLNTMFIESSAGHEDDYASRPPDQPLRHSASKAMLWERFSSSPQGPFKGCHACGRQDYPLPYMFRVNNYDDWSLIDRFCRDRLVAVAEFYVFIRNVRQGYYLNRSIHDLYNESMRLRLQMFYARLGSLPAMLASVGLEPYQVGKAQQPVHKDVSALKQLSLGVSKSEENVSSEKMDVPVSPRPSSLVYVIVVVGKFSLWKQGQLSGGSLFDQMAGAHGSYVIAGKKVANEYLTLATLASYGLIGVAATRGSGSKATTNTSPPINAGSVEEEDFIKEFLKNAEVAEEKKESKH